MKVGRVANAMDNGDFSCHRDARRNPLPSPPPARHAHRTAKPRARRDIAGVESMASRHRLGTDGLPDDYECDFPRCLSVSLSLLCAIRRHELTGPI